MGVRAAQLPSMCATPAENPELCANIKSWMAKIAPKLSSKYLND